MALRGQASIFWWGWFRSSGRFFIHLTRQIWFELFRNFTEISGTFFFFLEKRRIFPSFRVIKKRYQPFHWATSGKTIFDASSGLWYSALFSYSVHPLMELLDQLNAIGWIGFAYSKAVKTSHFDTHKSAKIKWGYTLCNLILDKNRNIQTFTPPPKKSPETDFRLCSEFYGLFRSSDKWKPCS